MSVADHPLAGASGLAYEPPRHAPPQPTEARDPMEEFFMRKLEPRKRYRISDVPPNLEGLKTLLQHGAWPVVIELSARISNPSYQVRLCRVVAQFKLDLLTAASSELSFIGHTFDDPRIPFTMRLLWARLPLYLKDSRQGTSRLYQLLAWCRKNTAELRPVSQPNPLSALQVGSDMECVPLPHEETTETPAEILEEPLRAPVDRSASPMEEVGSDPLSEALEEISQRKEGLAPGGAESEGPEQEAQPPEECPRLTHAQAIRHEVRVLVTLAGIYAASKDYLTALRNLGEALLLTPDTPSLWVQVIQTLLELGDIDSAQRVLTKLDELTGSEHPILLVARGLIETASGRYSEGLNYFNRVLHGHPSHVVAANNASICHVHMGKINEAINVLENLIRGDPYHTINETVVHNLCVLYDLSRDHSKGHKFFLQHIVKTYGPENFSLNVFRL